VEKPVQVFTLEGRSIGQNQLRFNNHSIGFLKLGFIRQSDKYDLPTATTNAKGGTKVCFVFMGTAIVVCRHITAESSLL
jgi:hypothetical protein